MKKNYGNGENFNPNANNAIDDDSYFDNRLNEMFNEIVQLRAEQSQLSAQSNAPARPAGESALQDEIMRLKEELNRNKSSQDLRSEMSLLKSELGRDSYLLEEIRKINERLDVIHHPERKPSEPRAAAKPDESEQYVYESVVDVSEDIAHIKQMLATKTAYQRQFTAYDDIYAILVNEICGLREDFLSKSGDEALDSASLLARLDNIFDETIRIKARVERSEEEIRAEVAENSTSKDDIADISAQIMALREEFKATKILEQDEVLRELEALRKEVTESKYRTVITTADGDEVQPTSAEANFMVNEIASLRHEIATYQEELARKGGGGTASLSADDMAELRTAIEEVKEYATRRNSFIISDDSTGEGSASAMGLVLDEIQSLKSEITALKNELGNIKVESTGVEEIKTLVMQLADKDTEEGYEAVESVEERGFSILFDEITALRTEVGGNPEAIMAMQEAAIERAKAFASAPAPTYTSAYVQSGDGLSIDGEAIKADLAEIKKGIKAISIAAPAAASTDSSAPAPVVTYVHSGEGLSIDGEVIRAELAEIKKEITAINDEPNLTVLHEVLELRDEFQAVKEALIAGGHADVGGTSEFISDIKSISERMTVLSEVINSGTVNNYNGGEYNGENLTPELLTQFESLREHVAAIGEVINGSTAGDAEILSEIKTLRDQIFAINMAKVEDGDNERYANYNDIILEEIFELRDDFEDFVANSGNGEGQREFIERVFGLEEKINNLSSAEMTQEMRDTFKTEIEELKKEIANRRNADELTVNFMNEMALLLERQNELIAVGETQPKSRMEKLRDEIASTIVTQDIPSRRDIEELSRSIDLLKSNLTGIADIVNVDAVPTEPAPAPKRKGKKEKEDEVEAVITVNAESAAAETAKAESAATESAATESEPAEPTETTEPQATESNEVTETSEPTPDETADSDKPDSDGSTDTDAE